MLLFHPSNGPLGDQLSQKVLDRDLHQTFPHGVRLATVENLLCRFSENIPENKRRAEKCTLLRRPLYRVHSARSSGAFAPGRVHAGLCHAFLVFTGKKRETLAVQISHLHVRFMRSWYVNGGAKTRTLDSESKQVVQNISEGIV